MLTLVLDIGLELVLDLVIDMVLPLVLDLMLDMGLELVLDMGLDMGLPLVIDMVLMFTAYNSKCEEHNSGLNDGIKQYGLTCNPD